MICKDKSDQIRLVSDKPLIIFLQRYAYQEAGPQLPLQAFLQRIINGGGRISREYGPGRGRTDLFLQWPLTPQGFAGQALPEGARYYKFGPTGRAPRVNGMS